MNVVNLVGLSLVGALAVFFVLCVLFPSIARRLGVKTFGEGWAEWRAENAALEERRQAREREERDAYFAKRAAMSEDDHLREQAREARSRRVIGSVVDWCIGLAIIGWVALYFDEVPPMYLLIGVVAVGFYAVVKAIERNKAGR